MMYILWRLLIYSSYKFSQLAQFVKSSSTDLRMYGIVFFGVFLMSAILNLDVFILVYSFLVLVVLYFVSDIRTGKDIEWWRNTHNIPSHGDIKKFKEMYKLGMERKEQVESE